MAKELHWRGLFAELVTAVGQETVSATATIEQLQEWCGKTHPERPSVTRSTLLPLRRRLVEARILRDTVPQKPVKPYEGFLFDGDSLIVTLGDKSWTFTREEARKIARLFGNLTAFGEMK